MLPKNRVSPSLLCSSPQVLVLLILAPICMVASVVGHLDEGHDERLGYRLVGPPDINDIDNTIEADQWPLKFEHSNAKSTSSPTFDGHEATGDQLEGCAQTHTNNHRIVDTGPPPSRVVEPTNNSRHYNGLAIAPTKPKYGPKPFGAPAPPSPSLNSVGGYAHAGLYPSSFNLNYIHNLLLNNNNNNGQSHNNNNKPSRFGASSSSPHGYMYTILGADEPQGPSIELSSNFHRPTAARHPHQQSESGNQPLSSVDEGPSASSTSCGRQQVSYREPRIVGGNSTYEGEFPWAVSIQRHGQHHCGGVIVGRRWILTAAHCVRSQLVSNLVIRTGGLTLARSPNSLNGNLERDYLVEQIVMHTDFSRFDPSGGASESLNNSTTSSRVPMTSSYKSATMSTTNNADIALVKLRQDIQWNELTWPVCFPSRLAGNFSGLDATVVGWGKLSEKSEDFSNELQKVKLTIIDNKQCQQWFRLAGREMPIDERILCAGLKSGGKDACHGDSGGPLLSKINGQYTVVGVVSTGIGCARPLLPGLYSRVSSYVDWIERHMAAN